MTLCLIDEQGRTLKDESMSKLTLKYMKHEGLSKVTNMSGGRLNSSKYLFELINSNRNDHDIVFLSDNLLPYKLDDKQKQKLITLLSQTPDSLSGSVIKTLLQQDGMSTLCRTVFIRSAFCIL